jgi:excisionase family DNA binding protein
MSIKEKLEQAQSSRVVFEITGDELAEFVKQLTTEQVEQKSTPAVITKVKDLPAAQKAASDISKNDKELQEKVLKLSERVEALENLIYESKQVLNAEEAAVFMGVSKSCLYKMTHNHELPFYRPNGKFLYFEKVELMKWLRSCRVSSEKEIEEAAKLKMIELASKALKRKK